MSRTYNLFPILLMALTYCLTVRATLAGPPKLQNLISTRYRCGGVDLLPGIGVCDDWDGGLQATNHLRRLFNCAIKLDKANVGSKQKILHQRNRSMSQSQHRVDPAVRQ